MNWGRQTKSWKREIVWTLVLTLAIAGWIQMMDKALSLTGEDVYGNIYSNETETSLSAKCVSDVTAPCTWAQKKSKAFKDGKLGKSTGIKLPKAFRDRLDNKQDAAGLAKGPMVDQEDMDWWDYPFEATMCLTNKANSTWDCMTKTESANKLANLIENTGKLSLVCGGAAFIGSLAGGGWWGAGKGAGICLWLAIWNGVPGGD